jgi:lipopolysaccharide exporter
VSGLPHEGPLERDARGGAENLDARILRSAGWVTLGRVGQTAVSTLSLLVLARLLDPKAFGLVALAGAILVVLELLQGSGVGAALIYRRHEVKEAAGSALVFSTLTGVALFGLALVGSPLLARAFGQPDATDVMRGLSVVLLIRGLGIAPTAILERGLNFRAWTVGELAATLAQAVISLSLAFAGLGVWSLVLGSIGAACFRTTTFWFLVPFRPSPRHASWRVLRELVGYGRFVAAGNLVTLFTRTLDNLVVARLLGATALGFYAVAFRLANMPANVFVGVVGRVMFPAYARLQDDRPAFRRAFVQNLQRIALLALPVGVGLAVAGEPIVSALLGDSWLAAVDPLRVLAVYALVRSFASPCGAVYQAAGKPGLVPLLALPMLVVMIPALILLTHRFGATGAAFAMLLAMVCSAVPSLAVALRILGLRTSELARALAPAFLCSGLLAVALALLSEPTRVLPPLPRLATLVAVGGLVYAVSVAVFAREPVARAWLSLRGASRMPHPESGT